MSGSAAAARSKVASQFCFDEGRAAAMNGLRAERANPYRPDIEAPAYQSWIAGYRSFDP